jgi:phage baseplate assembly protein W
MMLTELRLLLAACPIQTSPDGYRLAIEEDNILLKHTQATRRESFRRLRELYGLNNNLLLFQALRELWEQEIDAQPLLALFCALARDPVLRLTSPVILQTAPGERVDAPMFSRCVQELHPEPLNAMTLGNIGRHAASTWTQSGHLSGRTNKVRVHVSATLPAVVFALLIGNLTGARGDMLFQTLWANLLDTSAHFLREMAVLATQQGWLEYRHTGQVTEIGFRHFLKGEPHE